MCGGAGENSEEAEGEASDLEVSSARVQIESKKRLAKKGMWCQSSLQSPISTVAMVLLAFTFKRIYHKQIIGLPIL
jgi:hypothetical protein